MKHPRYLRLSAVLALASLAAAAPRAAAEEVERIDLEQLMALALDDPRATMARHATSAARARHAEARAARYPSVDVTAFLAPSPDIDCENAECTRTSTRDISLAFDGVFGGANLDVVQPLYTFGKLDAISRAASRAVAASRHLEDSVAGDLAFQAAQAYFGLKLARELRWMLEDGLAEIDRAIEKIEERLEEGSDEVTLQDRFRVETLRAEAEARLTEAKQAEAQALAGIQALAGRADIDIDQEPLAPVSFDLASIDRYIDRARDQSPQLEAARAGAEAAEAKASFESAHYWPNIVLLGRLGFARAQGVDDPPSAFARDPFNHTTAGLTVALQWDLDPLTTRARARQAQAESDQAEALVELADMGAVFDVRKAHAEVASAKERVDATQRGEKSARAWMASVLQADAIGTASAKDLADAFIAYFTLHARYITSVYEWNIATVRLRRAVGEFKAGNPRPAADRSPVREERAPVTISE